MNRLPSFGNIDGERMDRMHSANARYIIDTLPRRLYHHFEWGNLEYSTVRLPDDKAKGSRAMIGICHSPYNQEICVATYVLYEDGSMYLYDAEKDQKFPYGIRYAHLQMLLSEYSLHDWNIHNPLRQRKYLAATGVSLEEPAIAHQPLLYRTMEQVRAAYGEILS